MAKTVEQARQHASDLEQAYAERDKLFEKMDQMFLMDWQNKPTREDLKFTASPDPRNAAQGAIRLLSATEPVFSVPREKNSAMEESASQVEKLCQTIWYHSGRFKQIPLEEVVVESLIRYGMSVMVITDTEDLLSKFGKSGSKAQKRQVERVARRTPYLVEAWDPRTVYPQWGRFGLTAIYRTVTMTVGEIRQQFGADEVPELAEAEESELYQYADYWDLDSHIAWIGTAADSSEMVGAEPIVNIEHKLPCIPIVVQTGEGSYLDERQYQAIPFLYGVDKGNLWERQNLIYTYGFTNLYRMAMNPTYWTDAPESTEITLDTSVAGGIIRTPGGNGIKLLEKDVWNKDLQLGMELANKMIEDSTIFRQALGQPMGSNASYSMVALLHQAGRLPLTSPQKRGGWGIGTVMETMIEMWKDKAESSTGKGKSLKALTRNGKTLELDVQKLPDDLLIEAKLDVALPQDMMQQATIAAQLNGLAPKEWIRENLLNEGQSDEMDKQIWTEQAADAMVQQKIQTIVQKATLEAQQQMQQEQMQQQMMAQQRMGGQQGMMPPDMPQGGQMPPTQMRKQNRRQPSGPMAGAMQAQAGMVPTGRPGTQPMPAGADQPMQEGEVQ